jgi:hypothetical protein
VQLTVNEAAFRLIGQPPRAKTMRPMVVRTGRPAR